MIPFLKQRWFLIMLAIAMVVGIGGGSRLQGFVEHKWLRDADVAFVLFLMALPLEASTIWQTIRRPYASLLAVLVTFGILPLVAWGVSFLLTGGQGPGLLIAAATPCTVASAAVWTRRAGGNDAVATMVTVVTNAICFVVTPLWLVIFLGPDARSDELEFKSAVLQLGRIVVLPMLAAQLIRLYAPIARWSFRHKLALSIVAQLGLLFMVLSGAIQTGIQLSRSDGSSATAPGLFDFVLMLAAVVFVHVSMFWCGLRLAQWCGLPRADQIAVGFSGSQKTLMIGLKVALDLNISILPMVTYHVAQLLVDTVIADRIVRADAAAKLARETRIQVDSPSKPS